MDGPAYFKRSCIHGCLKNTKQIVNKPITSTI